MTRIAFPQTPQLRQVFRIDTLLVDTSGKVSSFLVTILFSKSFSDCVTLNVINTFRFGQ